MTPQQTPPEIARETPVWDLAVRSLHWLLAASAVAGWITGHWFVPLHHAIGYGAAAVVALRAVWGVVGGHHARFAGFVRGPRPTWAYVRGLLAGQRARHLGHNPLGGWMALALLACVGATSLTGFLYVTDWLWGYAWLEALHRGLAWLLVALAGLHLCGVALMSWRGRENLVKAMVTGRKRE